MCTTSVIVPIQESDRGDAKEDGSCGLVLLASACMELPWSAFVADHCSHSCCLDETIINLCYGLSANIDHSIQDGINLNAIGRFALPTTNIVCQVIDL
jgi:hypothetical protein